MASVTLRLALRNVDGDWLDDPRVVVRLQNVTSGSVPAVVSFAATPGIQHIEVDVADGQIYRVEITPTRYSAFVKEWRADTSGADTITATLARRASEWQPSFDIWAGLSATLEPLKTVLQDSSTMRVGRNTAPGLIIGDAWDAIGSDDESRWMAKASLLNMFARLDGTESPNGTPWFGYVEELFVANRERVICAIAKDAFDLVKAINTTASDYEGYKKAPATEHRTNFLEMAAFVPGLTLPATIEPVSVKTLDAYGNLQLTVLRATRNGRACYLLDSDIDENSQVLLHLFDMAAHVFTGGTHPLDVREVLRVQMPDRDLGYVIVPATPESHVTVTIKPLAVPPPAGAAPLASVVVIGDSVAWGQGLLDAQKMHSLVVASLNRTGMPPTIQMLAHSGAVIGAGAVAGDDWIGPPDLGEVPEGFPTVVEQVARAEHPALADFVLVNGGINDVDIRTILNPLIAVSDVKRRTERHCGTDLEELLLAVCAVFTNPSARIVVPSYFPILSGKSRISWGLAFLEGAGAPLAAAVSSLEALGTPWGRIVENCRVFDVASRVAMRDAVDRVNATPSGAGRLRFAAAAFTDDNAALAPTPWLFGVNWNLTPQDPMAARRRVICDLVHDQDVFARSQCYLASAGHPNDAGAQAFANAILQAW